MMIMSGISRISRTRRKAINKIATLVHRNCVRVDSQQRLDLAYFAPNHLRSLSNILKPWPEAVYECDGDYRKETFLEEHIGGPLYAEQNNLPRLPVPSIEETIERFLPTALPLAKTEEERAELESACRNFPSEARDLQQRLQDYRDNEMMDSSWLQKWWTQMGYLQVRDSVVHNVSYFLQFEKDPTIEASKSSQVQRAATALFATAKFRNEVCSGQLPPERIGRKKTLLCSATYKYLFNACRMPLHQQDSYCIYDPSKIRHVIVARKGHFFAFDFVDEAGDPLPTFILEEQLQKCIEMADHIPSTRPKLGALTALDRDSWASSRERLIKIGGESMEEALTMLQSGSIVLCLDDEAGVSMESRAQQFLSGGHGSYNNRWFDKSINLIVDINGDAAVLCEHSMMDGMAVVRYADNITIVNYSDICNRSRKRDPSATKVLDVFENVFAEITESSIPEMVSLGEYAQEESKRNIDRHSIMVNRFDAYGADYIKEKGHSPDAFVQIAIHLATYRLFGSMAATYEATQVRPFLHGRTETTRTISLEAEAFVLNMGQSPAGKETDREARCEKLKLLKRATTSHSRYLVKASKANGVDRHFFGLSRVIDDSAAPPSLYSNPLFNDSKHWRVSTSNLTHHKIQNWGFGQVVPEGVGIAYSVHPSYCVFNIVALEDNNLTSRLTMLISESLDEIHALVESGG